jgi:secreted trypsin-like serine protease
LSNDLIEVALPLLSDSDCKQYYSPYKIDIVTMTQICAGRAGQHKDTCRGDSGGPLVAKNTTDERWYLIGITSYGFGCGNNGVYTRVSSFYNWILSQINISN